MFEPVALIALLLDALIGWPAWLYTRIGHPVGAFARLIDGCERRWNRPTIGAGRRRLFGVATMLLIVLLSAGPAWLIQYAVQHFSDAVALLILALCAFPALAQRSLYEHVIAVDRALCAADIVQARHAVGMIVGRDTAALDGAGVARAAIESLAESFCDGIVAPLFWLLSLGLPGIWAYKAVNTADSLIGHREERWRAFGWAAARMDDVMNLFPARLGGMILCLAGGGGWRVMGRNAHNHASPNAGWTEAAMAGALGLRLGGPVAYDGVAYAKPWIGDGQSSATAADIGRALGVYRRACLILWLVASIPILYLLFRNMP